jgi:hypothetical protein
MTLPVLVSILPLNHTKNPMDLMYMLTSLSRESKKEFVNIEGVAYIVEI